MKRTVTPKQRKKILQMKKDAIYRHTEKATKKTDKEYIFRRHHINRLAEAWMKYIDYLKVNKYKSKNFNYKHNHSGSQCIFTDELFTMGERAAITKYLKENGLITVDNWNFYVVQWRKKHGKKETTNDQ